MPISNTIGQVSQIITSAGGKSYRRPYDEEDIQVLRDGIYKLVREWGNGEEDLSQFDTKRMALDALVLSILDVEDVGDTDADIDEFLKLAAAEAHHLMQLMLQGTPVTTEQRHAIQALTKAFGWKD